MRFVCQSLLILTAVLLIGCGASGSSSSASASSDLAPIRPPGQLAPMNIYGESDWEEARCYWGTDYYEAARSVCRISIKNKGLCTGSLVGPDLVLTNQHCIGSAANAADSTFRFDYEAAACGQPKGDWVEYQGSEVVWISERIDLALVRITDPDWPSSRPYLRIHRQEPIPNDVIWMPQHAEGKAKRFAVKSDHEFDSDTDSYNFPPGSEGLGHLTPLGEGLQGSAVYKLDSEGGSSGSPVLRAADHELIALHFSTGSGFWASDVLQEIERFLPPDSAAYLAFDDDADRLPVTGQTTVHLHDADLAGSGSIVLDLTTIAGDSEQVTLTEAGDRPGAFSGSIDLLRAEPVSGDGRIQTGYMGLLTVVYQDADDGTGSGRELRTSAVFDDRSFRLYEAAADDLDQVQFTFTPDDGVPNGYRICQQTISELPVDPTDMTDFDLTTFGPYPVTLPKPVRLFNRSYSDVAVSTNGHINLGPEARKITQSGVFGEPRIILARMTLLADSDSRLGYQVLADRIVFTWWQLPAYFNPFTYPDRESFANTLQLECFDDGRLRFTLLAIDPLEDYAIGLSDGLEPADDPVAGIDFSAQPSCDPGNRAPVIDSLTADPAMVTGTSTRVTVVASDADGDDLTTAWQLIDAPTGASPDLQPDGDAVDIQFDQAGSYTVEATVSDPQGASASDRVIVDVLQQASVLGIQP